MAQRHDLDSRRAGFALVLLSASGFASLAIFGKQAYEAGFDVPEVLAVRFGLAAPMLFAIAMATGRTRTLRLSRPMLVRVLAMGAVGYAVQSTLFFAALSRIPASLTGLLLYLYPTLVTIGAVALGRHRATRLTIAGLSLSLAGTPLIVGRPAGHIDGLGVVLALCAAVWFSAYILVGEWLLADVDPLVISVYVCTGAAASFAIVGGLVLGRLDFAGIKAQGWPPLIGMAVVGTAIAIFTFFAGMARIGSTWASISASWEPVCTVVLGVLVLHDRLGAGTVVGGAAVVLGAIVLPLVGGDGQTRAPAERAHPSEPFPPSP
jgi:drug/metabolite transporter (DMT)-like permease